MMSKIGNDYIVEGLLPKINKVLDDNYINNINLEEAKNELTYAQEKLHKHKLDFIIHSFKYYLNRKVKINEKDTKTYEENVLFEFFTVGLWMGWFVIAFVLWGILAITPIFTVANALIPAGAFFTSYLWYQLFIKPLVYSIYNHAMVEDNIKDKIAFIKEQELDMNHKVEVKNTESLYKIDSFIREIVKDKAKLEGLDAHDKALFRDKLIAIAKEYIEYTFRADMSSKIPSPALKDNKEIEKLYKELIMVEEEIEVSHKKNKNIEVLSDTFGDITKLDTSIVELDTALDAKLKLDRKLNK